MAVYEALLKKRVRSNIWRYKPMERRVELAAPEWTDCNKRELSRQGRKHRRYELPVGVVHAQRVSILLGLIVEAIALGF